MNSFGKPFGISRRTGTFKNPLWPIRSIRRRWGCAARLGRTPFYVYGLHIWWFVSFRSAKAAAVCFCDPALWWRKESTEGFLNCAASYMFVLHSTRAFHQLVHAHISIIIPAGFDTPCGFSRRASSGISHQNSHDQAYQMASQSAQTRFRTSAEIKTQARL